MGMLDKKSRGSTMRSAESRTRSAMQITLAVWAIYFPPVTGFMKTESGEVLGILMMDREDLSFKKESRSKTWIKMERTEGFWNVYPFSVPQAGLAALCGNS